MTPVSANLPVGSEGKQTGDPLLSEVWFRSGRGRNIQYECCGIRDQDDPEKVSWKLLAQGEYEKRILSAYASLVSRGRAQPATAKFIEAAAAPVPHSLTSMPALCITDDSSEPSRRSSDSRLPHQRKTGGAACFEERLLRDHLQGVQRAAFTTSRNQPDNPSG